MSVGLEQDHIHSDDESSLETTNIDGGDSTGNRVVETLIKCQEDTEQRFTCPLTLDFMVFPLKASDNQVYERYAILQWFFEHQTSPLTREPLDINAFNPEKNLQLEIRNYLNTNNIDIPELPNTGYTMWKRVVILKHMINYSSQNSRFRENMIESDLSNMISSENQIRRIRNGRNTSGSHSARRERLRNIDRARGRDGDSAESSRHTRRDQSRQTPRNTVYCEGCRQDVYVLSFREYPFQSCRCGMLLTRIPPPNSSIGESRTNCIIS